MPRGCHHGGCTRRPHARRSPQTTHAMLGADSRGVCHGGEAPPGFDHENRPSPCPSGPHGGRVGVLRSGERPSPSATATGNTAPNYPGQQLEGPSQTMPTRSPPDGTRETGSPGGRRHGPCIGGLSVGHGPRGGRDLVRPTDGTRLTAPLRRCPPCISRDAAPVWCTPRRREETDGHPRASSEAGTRRRPVRWTQPTDRSRINRRL
jgi:hypothetical protein